VPDLIAKGSITAENMNVTGQTVFDSMQVNNKIKIGNSIVLEDLTTPEGDINHIYTTLGSGDLMIQSEPDNNQNTIINANNEGKVGIGTDNPGSDFEDPSRLKLDVRGDGRFGYSENNYIRIGYNSANSIIDNFGEGKLLINWYSGKNVVIGGSGDDWELPNTGTFTAIHDAYLATGDGNVGIGTTDTQTKLHIFSNDNPTCGTQLRIEYLSTEPPDGCPGSSIWDLNAQGGGKLTFQNYSTSNSVMTLTKDGNVGIGTTNPENKLDVNGSVFIQGEGNVWTSNAHWNVVLKTPLASAAWRSSIPSDVNNKYLGFGMTNEGWYWIMSDADDNTQPAEYPMSLTLSAPGVSPQCQLNVCGTIKAKEIIVEETDGCDYVFEDDYKRMTPEEKAKYYKEKKHLFGLPSAKEIEKNGLKIGKTMSGLTLNVEELSLDFIDLYKIIIEQKKEIEQLKKRLETLEQK